MSDRLVLEVWRESPLAGGHLTILLALAEAADEEGQVTASAQQLAPRARIAIRRAQQILTELEEQRHVEVLVRGGGRGRFNTWRVLTNTAKSAVFQENTAKSAVFTAANTATNAVFPPPNTAKIAAFPPKRRKKCGVSTLPEAETPQGLRSFSAPPGPPLKDTVQAEVLFPPPTQEKAPLPTTSAEEPPSVRDLTEPQMAVAAVTRMFEDADADPPTPSSINRWFGRYKSPPHRGDLAGFIAFMEDLVPRAVKKGNPHGYVVNALSSPPRRRKAALPKTLSAGADSARARQAEELARRSRARAGGSS